MGREDMQTTNYNPLLKLFPAYRRPRSVLSLIWLFALLRRGRVIILTDHEGTEYRTIARARPDGSVRAHVFWFCKVGSVILKEDGTVDPMSYSSYIRTWRFP
jgi:hypothetical protein